jgi:L-amino acid N-acyltransferase YncA
VSGAFSHDLLNAALSEERNLPGRRHFQRVAVPNSSSILADIPHITAIYSRFVTTSTATFEIVAPDESEMLRRRQTVLDRDLPYLVAELEGYIVGFCYASQFRPREGYRFTVEDSIYVRPDCIGHGVGKALLAELILQC